MRKNDNENAADNLCFNFMGGSYDVSFEEFTAFIADKITQFDEMRLVYAERGKNIEICADNKNVITETKAAENDKGAGQSVSVMSDREYFINQAGRPPFLKLSEYSARTGR